MEIIMINNCKLKVMLGEEDLRRFEIKAEQLDYSNTETKRMFWDILNKAKRETGFDTEGQRVLVQLYPSKHGGCEMFVTKIGLLPSRNVSNTSFNEENKLLISSVGKDSNQTIPIQIALSFESINMIIFVCKRLHAMDCVGQSSFYVSDSGKKYLFLSDIHIINHSEPNELSFVFEFASAENPECFENLSLEHGKFVFENNAVAKLSEF
jgi:negative regulator of genetic competence, sporulation and motility